MDKPKLNLGQFNQCIDYLDDGQNSDFPVGDEQKVYYYMSHNGDIVSTELAKGSITIPVFDVGAVLSKGLVNDADTIKRLLASIELEVFAMLKRILKESGNFYDFTLDQISLPVKAFHVHDDISGRPSRPTGGSYGWVEIGIAVFV